MDLIIKPTEACNFHCTFCSSTNISPEHTRVLDLKRVDEFLTRFPNTNTIIVNGGDPLMVPPSYYYQLIDIVETHGLNIPISLTTNLWAYYKKPILWRELFSHPLIQIGTSFNYGNTRLITPTRPLTDVIFKDICYMFRDDFGYVPDFISVITEENESTAIDNVLLAKELNVVCKLNYGMKSGAQTVPYMLGKIYRTYVKIHQMSLTPWEYNTQQLVKRLSHGNTTCPQNRSCDSGIRCIQPAGDYYSCGAFGDDGEYQISFEEEMVGPLVLPLNQSEIFSLKDECISCPLFDICNGCKKTIKDMKSQGMEFISSHCKIMKSLENDILHMNGLKKEYSLNSIPFIAIS